MSHDINDTKQFHKEFAGAPTFIEAIACDYLKFHKWWVSPLGWNMVCSRCGKQREFRKGE